MRSIVVFLSGIGLYTFGFIDDQGKAGTFGLILIFVGLVSMFSGFINSQGSKK